LNLISKGAVVKKFYLILIVLFSLVLIAANLALGNDFNEKLKKAKEGDPLAQYAVGLAYAIGSDVEKDPIESNKWIHVAAENGYPPAQLYYGQFLPNKVVGLQWIGKAANNGDAKAQRFLGELFRTENNGYVSKDIDEAIRWLTMAANNIGSFSTIGDQEAIFRLAMMYEEGDGIEKDLVKSSEWLSKLVNNPGDFEYTENLYIKGKLLGKSLSYHAIMPLRIAAERNHPGAQYELGLLYKYGVNNKPGVGEFSLKPNKEKLMMWLNLAAINQPQNCDWNANSGLGEIYENGVFDIYNKANGYLIKPDHIKALKYYRTAARQGSKEAQSKLDEIGKHEVKLWGYNDANEKGTLTIYKDLMFHETVFGADVALSKGGEKRVYFSIRTLKDEKCKSDYYDSIWRFNDQPVSMNIFCEKDDTYNEYQISATPKSSQGLENVVNLLKKAPDKILVEGSGYEFPISAKGFSRVWASVKSVKKEVKESTYPLIDGGWYLFFVGEHHMSLLNPDTFRCYDSSVSFTEMTLESYRGGGLRIEKRTEVDCNKWLSRTIGDVRHYDWKTGNSIDSWTPDDQWRTPKTGSVLDVQMKWACVYCEKGKDTLIELLSENHNELYERAKGTDIPIQR
jgi:TPR repeat protein